MIMLYNKLKKVTIIDRRERVSVITFKKGKQRFHRTVPNSSLTPIIEVNRLGIKVL